MKIEYFQFVHHTTCILIELSSWCFEHSGDVSVSLLVNLNHTDESWEGRNTCLWIYIYIYIYIFTIFTTTFLPPAQSSQFPCHHCEFVVLLHKTVLKFINKFSMSYTFTLIRRGQCQQQQMFQTKATNFGKFCLVRYS